MESVGEKLLFGLQTAVLGLIVVFVGLLLIIVMIKIVGAIVKAISKKNSKPEKKIEKTEEPIAVEKPAVLSDDKELVAAITAAVACMLNTDTGKVKIKSIRKAGGSAWARANRKEQIYNNF